MNGNDELDDRDRAEDFLERREAGQLDDANDDAMDRWARRYDELNGAPENEEDR